jgi:transposase
VWLQSLAWPLAALEQTFRSYVHAVNETEGRLKLVEDDLRAYFTTGPFAESVQRLRCFRGIRELTALTIAAELGDARRFPTAPRVMGFAGLVPSEHSSGSRRGRGAITKTGNAHLRRVLLEAAWHYRHHPHLGLSLRNRQTGAPPEVVARAWQAQHRLFRTYRRLIGRGRPPQIATTAVARELAGFVWATLAS